MSIPSSSSPSPSTPPQSSPMDAQQLLALLAMVSQQFIAWLDTEPEIDVMDQISINNHLSLLYMTYGKWKTKRGPGAG